MTHATYAITDVAPLAKQGGDLRFTLDPHHGDFGKFQKVAKNLGINVSDNQTLVTISKVVGVKVLDDLQKEKLVARSKIEGLADRVTTLAYNASHPAAAIIREERAAPVNKHAKKPAAKTPEVSA